jgi:nucleoside-diphosphate-sugar epimerase
MAHHILLFTIPITSQHNSEHVKTPTAAVPPDIEDVDAVISTIGGTTKDPSADSIGNINVIEAAAAKGVKKFILVTSIGCGDTKDAPGEQVGWELGQGCCGLHVTALQGRTGVAAGMLCQSWRVHAVLSGVTAGAWLKPSACTAPANAAACAGVPGAGAGAA